VNDKTFAAFISPSVILMVLLMVFPFGTAIWLGLNQITFANLAHPNYIGFQNYADVLHDPAFWHSMQFTLVYVVITMPVQILLGFVIASLLDQVTHLRGLIISISLLPHIVAPIVGTLIFRNTFDQGGIYAYLYRLIVNKELIWTTLSVKTVIILEGIWSSTPFAMITLFAGLQTLDREQIEAATVDGANFLQKIRYVVVPHLRSLILFIALMSTMDGYRVFDSILVITKQNPMFKADTIMYYTFKTALTFQELGKANAMSVITVIGIFVVLIPFLVSTYRQQLEKR
jgi:ABC-type sugar transport system permease subunit